MSFRVEENGQFRGQVSFLNIVVQDGAINNAKVAAAAGINASKLEHQHRAVLSQESGTAATDVARVVHVVKGTAGKLLTFKCGVVVACVGVAEIDFDLLVNGASILVAAVTVDNGDAAYALVAGVIDTDTLAAGDVVEISIDETTGGGTQGKGAFAYVDLEEDYD